MENNTHYTGCSCHSNPPCSFCVDTFICDCCGNREYAAEAVEEELGFICLKCQEDTTVSIKVEFEKKETYFIVYVAGRKSIRITNVRPSKGFPFSNFIEWSIEFVQRTYIH